MKKVWLVCFVMLAALLFTAKAEAGIITIANIDVDSLNIVELYVSEAEADSWGDDLLDRPLAKNADIEVEVSTEGFDVHVVWEDGTEDTYNNLGNAPQNSMLLLGKNRIMVGPH
ncbi:hypothetical protein AGMMS49959_00870 [Planctomycetales bacterium]|nr:hypothetical protein AGMMS49959_00870 [Planctomycetales bacterium]